MGVLDDPAASEALETAFLNEMEATTAFATLLPFEPQTLPELPLLTMIIKRDDQVDDETGGGMAASYEWTLILYLPLNTKWEDSQQLLKRIVPLMRARIRQSSPLNDLCDFVELRDDGIDPIFDEGEATLAKILRLRVQREEF
ncbi:MAG: hypothetical protein ACJ76I_11855 [Gaiellaceae bacterium]